MRKLLSLFFAVALVGCASAPEPMATQASKEDWRAGTDYSPYRSISPVIVCDECRP